MNIHKLRIIHGLLIKAAVSKQGIEAPEWRFDGKAIKTAEEVALVCSIPLIEAKEVLAQKDIHGGLGASVATVGIGTRVLHQGIRRRAHALAYGKRRRRRIKKEKSQ